MHGSKRSSKSEPCEICRKDHGCVRHADGLIICLRINSKAETPFGYRYIGEAKNGMGGLFRAVGDVRGQRIGPAPTPAKPAAAAKPKVRQSTEELAEKFAAARKRFLESPTAAKLLAEQLELPQAALDALEICCAPPHQAGLLNRAGFGFPEYNADLQLVTLNWRPLDTYVDPKKMAEKNADRGLTLPKGWRERAVELRELLIVEGASDVLALTYAGLAVVGRHNNCGNPEDLAKLLGPLVMAGVRVIVMGENDQKLNGDWPGSKGMKAVAGHLANAWGRPVEMALPPDGEKDARTWVIRFGADGKKFRASLTLETAQPTVVPAPAEAKAAGPVAIKIPRREEPACPCPPKVAIRGVVETNRKKFMRIPVNCRKLCCPVCGLHKRLCWCDRLEASVQATVPGDVLYLQLESTPEQWKSDNRQVRRLGAGACRVLLPDGKVATCCTHKLKGAVALPKEDGLAQFREILMTVVPALQQPEPEEHEDEDGEQKSRPVLVSWSGTWRVIKEKDEPNDWTSFLGPEYPQPRYSELVAAAEQLQISFEDLGDETLRGEAATEQLMTQFVELVRDMVNVRFYTVPVKKYPSAKTDIRPLDPLDLDDRPLSLADLDAWWDAECDRRGGMAT